MATEYAAGVTQSHRGLWSIDDRPDALIGYAVDALLKGPAPQR
jgi:hypothetical protein